MAGKLGLSKSECNPVFKPVSFCLGQQLTSDWLEMPNTVSGVGPSSVGDQIRPEGSIITGEALSSMSSSK